MNIVSAAEPLLRRRKAQEGGRVWPGSTAQREWVSAFGILEWDRCPSDDYIRVLPYLVAGGPVSSCQLTHFAARFASLPAEAPHRSKRRFADGLTDAGDGEIPDEGAQLAGSQLWPEPSTPRAELKALLNALRLGITPGYESKLAASLAFWIGLHPLYIWQEALLSHEMFLTLGWLGHVRHRGGAWMPAAVAEYLVDVIAIDAVGFHNVNEPLVAEVVTGQAMRIAVASASEDRLRQDEAFLRWPAPPRKRIEP